MKIQFAAPCLFGLESLVADELKQMEAQNVRAEDGRVFFEGDESMLARANICSRFAERILIVLGTFPAHTFEDLFQGVKALPLENWIGPFDAFPVKGHSIKSDLFSVRDCQSIIQKAAVERLKSVYNISWFEQTGAKHQLIFSIMKNQVHLFLDTSGEPLHKRGYRPEANAAPLRETLAAALCAFSRLRPYHTLYDPICGSGTILIEGAMLANKIAPGLKRNFAAERFEQLPESIWQEQRDWAKAQEIEANGFMAYGSDISKAALRLSRENAIRAGVSDKIVLTHWDLEHFKPQTDRGTVICNPPYGERMEDKKKASELIRLMGKVFPKQKGFSYSIISPEETFEELFGRKADKRRKLYNGMIKCQLYMYFK